MKKIYPILFLILIVSQACTRYDEELAENNPLLNEFNTPHQTLPFDEIKPEHLLPAVDITAKNLLREIKRVSRLKEEPTFGNTFLPIEIEADKLFMVVSCANNLKYANNNEEIHEAVQQIEKKLTILKAKVAFNHKIVQRFKSLYENRTTLANKSQKAAIEKVHFKFQNIIDPGFFKKLKIVIIEIKGANLFSKFSNNLLEEINAYELHITDSMKLTGIPQVTIDAAAETAINKEKKGWIFTLQWPSFLPVIRNAQDREIREKIYRAYVRKGNNNNEFDNKKFIKETIKMRIQTSQLLGYDTYAQYALKNRMASTPEKVNKFIIELTDAVKPYAENDIQEIRNYMEKEGVKGEPQRWDYSYYITKLKEEKYGYKEEETRPFFELNKVRQGTFDLANTLYGVTFQRNSDIQVYQEDVEAYEVFDQDKSYLGILYLDFYPRKGKESGAWTTNFKDQRIRKGKNIRPHTSIVTNFTKPTSTKPSLITFEEMSIFLHEFGHALHMLFSNVKYTSIGSSSVCWDFIELPSQIMENWALEKDWLILWAKHYKTGEPIPDELVDKIIASKNYFSAYNQFNQLKWDKLDMAWHLLKEFPQEGVKAFEVEAIKDYTFRPPLVEASISTNFGHIFAQNEYAAGYYSYHWAEVLDADAFIMFKENGIFDKATATSFRKNILEKGASEHPMVLYKNFRGREPSIDAMLVRSGLKAY